MIPSAVCAFITNCFKSSIKYCENKIVKLLAQKKLPKWLRNVCKTKFHVQFHIYFSTSFTFYFLVSYT